MMGTADQPRTSRISATPSPSGSPRSSTSRSGWRVPAADSPSRNVAASCTCQPPPPQARRARSGGSGARPRSRSRCAGAGSSAGIHSGEVAIGPGGVGSVFIRELGGFPHGRRVAPRQGDGEFCSRPGPGTRCRDIAAMRQHHGAANREPQPHAGRGRFGLSARELVEQRVLAAPQRRRQSGAVVAHADAQRAGQGLGGDVDGQGRRTWRRSPAGSRARARSAPRRTPRAAGPQAAPCALPAHRVRAVPRGWPSPLPLPPTASRAAGARCRPRGRSPAGPCPAGC